MIFTGGRRADHRGLAQCFLGHTAANQTADAGREGGRQAKPPINISEHRNGHQHTQVRYLHIFNAKKDFYFNILNYFFIIKSAFVLYVYISSYQQHL